MSLGLNSKFSALFNLPPTHPHCKRETQEGALPESFTVKNLAWPRVDGVPGFPGGG